MSLAIKDSTGTTRNVLEVQDLAASKFACISNVIEPVVSSNNSIDGTGSSVNPLAVVPSTDVGNALTLGVDGKLFVASSAGFAFTVSDSVNTQTISNGNTLSVLGTNDITVTVSPTDTVTISNTRPTRTLACALVYFTGV